MRRDNHLLRHCYMARRNQERLRQWRQRYEFYLMQQKEKARGKSNA